MDQEPKSRSAQVQALPSLGLSVSLPPVHPRGHQQEAPSRMAFSIGTLSFHYPEGNGNPLQRSCLENPRDRGAWWAAVYGVAQSRTQLKRLSSSSRHDEIKHWPQEWTQSPALLPSPSQTSDTVERGVLLFSWLRPLRHTTTDWEVWMMGIHFSQLGRLEVQEQGACWRCSLAKALNPVCRLFSMSVNLLMRAPPSRPYYTLITSQRPHVQTPSRWELAFQHMNSEGTQSVHGGKTRHSKDFWNRIKARYICLLAHNTI